MKVTIFLLVFSLPFLSFAVTPQFWEENTQQQFSAGDPHSISITSDAELMLAPQLKKIYESTDSIIWKILNDGQTVFAATGNEGRVIKIDSAGKASTLLDTAELEVQSIALDSDKNLYAATSPDGKIYKIKKDGTSQIFFDPTDKYIWNLTFDSSGNLYVATGDQGKIYRVDKNGKGEVLVDTNEANITALLWDKEKGLIAGSDRNGILYAIESNGKASVLYDSDQQQITSIHRSGSGEIYFAAIAGLASVPETRSIQTLQPVPQVTTPQPTPDTTPDEQEGTVVTSVEITPFPSQPAMTPSRPTASQLFRINPDGTSELIYSSEDHILDIQPSSDPDSLFLSTGKKSKLIQLSKNKKSTILIKTAEDQLTSVLNQGKIYLATANPGHIYELVQSHSGSGTYFSDIKDTGTPSAWGRVTWKGNTPAGTTILLSTRSGNTKTPDDTWSAWSTPGADPSGQQISSPKGRFIQWKADLNTTDSKITPVLRSVRVAYLQQNIRPEIDSIVALSAGAVYKRAAGFQEGIAGSNEPVAEPAPQQPEFQPTPQATTSFLGKAEFRKGYQTITWNGSDANQDSLIYDVYYRPTNDKNWKLLAKELKENIFAWDTQTIPDGTYMIQIQVTDRLSNPGKFALNNSKESAPFDVDNSAPRLEVTQVSRSGKSATIQLKAEDQFSPIKQLQYSVTPGTWISVFPVDLIDDSPTETYKIEINEVPSTAEYVILKCLDQFQNASTIRHSLVGTK